MSTETIAAEPAAATAANTLSLIMLVDVHHLAVPWAIKLDGAVIEKGVATCLEEVRAVQLTKEVPQVFIDNGFHTQEVNEAAFEYGWTTCHGRDPRRKDIEESTFTLLPYSHPLPRRKHAGFIESFNALAEEVNETAVEKGWWDNERNNGEIIALMHSELSEALEALRHGNPPDDKIPEFTGVEAELADVVIRIMDMAPARGWRVAEAIIAKVEMNKTRDRMHGGKQF